MADATFQPKVYKTSNGDKQVVASGGELDIESGGSFKLAGTAVTSTAAELNILDGVTSTAAELNILDGVTATAAELNILDGVTSTAAELNILDGVTSTAAELNILDGVTSTAAELNILDGVTATAAQLNKSAGTGVVRSAKTTVDASAGGTAQTTNLTLLAAGDILLNVIARVATPFDGNATTTLEVGVAANADNYIDTLDFNPAAAADTVAQAHGGTNNDQKTHEYITASTQLIATWTNTASATAGAVDVHVVYVDNS